jgi:hypothetical protein
MSAVAATAAGNAQTRLDIEWEPLLFGPGPL